MQTVAEQSKKKTPRSTTRCNTPDAADAVGAKGVHESLPKRPRKRTWLTHCAARGRARSRSSHHSDHSGACRSRFSPKHTHTQGPKQRAGNGGTHSAIPDADGSGTATCSAHGAPLAAPGRRASGAAYPSARPAPSQPLPHAENERSRKAPCARTTPRHHTGHKARRR